MCVTRNMFFLEGFALIRARAGPIQAHIGPYEPIWAHIEPILGPILRPLKSLSPCLKYQSAFLDAL